MWTCPIPARSGWLLGVLLLAFVLRIAAAVTLQWQLDHVLHRQFLIEGDASGYLLLAERIADGKNYEIYTPPRRVLRMPGFPAFLALVMRAWGGGLLSLRIALCAVGTLACGLTYWLGRDLVGHQTGLVAAAMAAVSPVMTGFTPLILSETLFAACLLASLIALGRLFRRHLPASAIGGPPAQSESVARTASPFPVSRVAADSATAAPRAAPLALLAGALVGAACYVRPSWLLAAPLYGAALLILSPHRRYAAWHACLVVAALVAVLIPWGLRNLHVTGHFVLTTLWVGPSLYDGLNPEADGDSDMTFFDRDNLLARMSEYDVDRHYRREAWKFVTEHPGRTAQLALIKLARFWKPWPNAPQFDAWPAKLVVAAWFLPVLIFSVAGAWRLRADAVALLIAAGPLLYFTAIHLVFVSSLRYRLPAEYPLLVLAAAGWQSAWAWWRSAPSPSGADRRA